MAESHLAFTNPTSFTQIKEATGDRQKDFGAQRAEASGDLNTSFQLLRKDGTYSTLWCCGFFLGSPGLVFLRGLSFDN